MNRFYWLLLIAIVSACIDPLAIDTDEESATLVIDGMITTEQGPYSVRLSTSKGYDDFSNRAVSGATVTLFDDEGNDEVLTEVESGLYRTSITGIKGKVGGSYYITIVTSEGKKYQSAPETILPTVAIDSIYYELNTEIEYIGQFSTRERSYFQIYVDVSDIPGSRNFYRWETNRAMEFTSRARDGDTSPPPCCYRCFLFYSDSEIALITDERQDGQKLIRIPIEQVGNGFSNIFSVRVKQFSLTSRAYEFWKNIDEQRNSVGSIFDPPPAVIRGNIVNTEDKEELVLGYFSASDVSRKVTIVPRPSYPVPGRVKFEAIGDCRDVDGATAIVPPEFR